MIEDRFDAQHKSNRNVVVHYSCLIFAIEQPDVDATGRSMQQLPFGDFPNGFSYREPFSRALGDEEGRTLAALLPPTSLPDASNTE